MAADCGAYAVYLHLAVKVRERGLNLVCNVARVVHAGGLGNIALAGIIKAVVCALLHAVNDSLYDLFLRADLFPGNKPAEVVHIQQRADVEHRSEEACRLGNSAALDVEAEIRGEEPVVQMQLVGFDPFASLVNAQTLVAFVGKRVHQKAVAGGCAERIDYVYLALGEILSEYLGCAACGVNCTGDTAGERYMQDVLALFKKRSKEIDVLGNVNLTGLGLRTLGHFLVKLLKWNALAEVIAVVLAVENIVEADIFDIARLEMLLRKVCRRAAANYIVRHFFLPN